MHYAFFISVLTDKMRKFKILLKKKGNEKSKKIKVI